MPTAIASGRRSCRENGGGITGGGGLNYKNRNENRREQCVSKTTRVVDMDKRLVAGEHRERRDTTRVTKHTQRNNASGLLESIVVRESLRKRCVRTKRRRG